MTRLPRRIGAHLAGAALLALALAGCAASTLPTVHSESERVPTARRLMARRDYTNAIELLKVYVQNNAGSAQVDEAIYLLGECYLRTREWPSAANEFERLTRDFPESDSAASASFRLGEAYWGQARGPDFDQESTQKALDQWQAYLRDHPGHWLNAEAERRVAEGRTRLARKLLGTADLYWKMRHTEPARIYYRQIADDFADTPVLGDALIGLALCQAREGQRDSSIAALRELETRFAGHPLAARAAHERERVEHGRIKAVREPKPIVKSDEGAGPTP